MMKIAITFSVCLSACNSFVMHHPGFVSSEIKWRQKSLTMSRHAPTYSRSNFLYSPLFAKPEDGDLYDAEEAAAFDAHDVSDPGMEGAAMERSVMMAQEMFAGEKKRSHEAHLKAEQAAHKNDAPDVPVSESETGEVDELFKAEEAAAFDAHDVSDPGMEGAAMERSVVMAQEMFEEEKKHHMEAEKAEKERNTSNVSLSESEPGEVDEIFEAEEAAAFDAHDVSDPGMEGAAMERAVFLAQELIAKKRKDAENKEKEKVSKEHINVMETAAENLAQLIDSSKKKKDNPEDYLALIEEADQEELALLLLERAVMNAAIKVQEKAEERMAAATAAVEAAVEAKKFAAAFARRASAYAERTRKEASSDRDLSSVASHLAEDAEYQLQLANDAEEKARKQEAEAKGSLEQIVEKESKLKDDLKELHDLTQIGVHEETD